MKERPILFSTPMVRSTLDGSKTQTRRTKALEHFSQNDPANWRCVRINNGYAYFVYKNSPIERAVKCPYGQPGDRLWVKESYRLLDSFDADSATRVAERCLDAGYKTPWAPIQYEADGFRRDWQHVGTPPHDGSPQAGKLRPNIFMTRWASRLLLEVTGVRVERLHDISEADAISEGITAPEIASLGPCGHPFHPTPALGLYMDLWEEINGSGSWAANPWVWVVEFKPVKLGIIKE